MRVEFLLAGLLLSCGSDAPSVEEACAAFCDRLGECFNDEVDEDELEWCEVECQAWEDDESYSDECLNKLAVYYECRADLSCEDLREVTFVDEDAGHCEEETEDADDACEDEYESEG